MLSQFVFGNLFNYELEIGCSLHDYLGYYVGLDGYLILYMGMASADVVNEGINMVICNL